MAGASASTLAAAVAVGLQALMWQVQTWQVLTWQLVQAEAEGEPQIQKQLQQLPKAALVRLPSGKHLGCVTTWQCMA